MGGDATKALQPLFENACCIKVFHSAHNDLRGLFHEFGFKCHGFIDTKEIAQSLGWEQLSLQALAHRCFGQHMDKTYQTADWGLRPLPKDMLDYASWDAQVLLPIADKMIA